VWQNVSSQARHPVRPYSWVFNRSEGGGWLRAWGSHAIDAAAWMFGPVDASDCRFFRALPTRPDRDGVVRGVDCEDGFAIRLTTHRGVHVEVLSSSSAGVTLPETLTVLGSDGALVMTGDATIDVLRHDRPVERVDGFAVPVVPDALRHLGRAVRHALEHGTDLAPDFATGVACARVLDTLTAAGDLVG
jgi:predicted dehydrogenase